jgi:hypothetical protein
MPLPDAEDPLTSNLYSQLRSSQLESVSSAAFDKVKDPVYVNSAFEDEARRIKLWGEISGKSSSSGPLANTGQITTATITGSGSANMGKPLTPGTGEVFDCMGISGLWNTSPGSSVTFGFYAVNDEDDTSVLLGTTSSTSTGPGFDVNEFLSKPFYLTYPFSLGVTVSTMGSAANVVISVYSIRVR